MSKDAGIVWFEEKMVDYKNINDLLKIYGVPCNANDNVFTPLQEEFSKGELTAGDTMVQASILPKVEQACQQLLDALLIDTDHDHNTKETAKRMAKMYVYEVFRGRYEPMPEIKSFPNVKNVDQIYTVGPATIRSACSHHMVPIMGQAWIGILPEKIDGRVMGLSKFVRLANWVFNRPQIQEEATQMLLDTIWEAIKPRGLAVVVRAHHLCMTWRGVQEQETSMVTSAMRGDIRDNDAARAEFFNLIKGQGY